MQLDTNIQLTLLGLNGPLDSKMPADILQKGDKTEPFPVRFQCWYHSHMQKSAYCFTNVKRRELWPILVCSWSSGKCHNLLVAKNLESIFAFLLRNHHHQQEQQQKQRESKLVSMKKNSDNQCFFFMLFIFFVIVVAWLVVDWSKKCFKPVQLLKSPKTSYEFIYIF